MKKEKLWFVAETENGRYWVYKQGRDITIESHNNHRHICHQYYTSQQQVISEIFIVYHDEVVRVRQPWELNM